MLLIDRLRGRNDTLTDEAADEIESLEKSYASLFKDCDKAQRDRAELVKILEECLRGVTQERAKRARAALAKARGE